MSIHKRLIAISTAAISFYHHHIGFYSTHTRHRMRITISAMIRDHVAQNFSHDFSFYIEIIFFSESNYISLLI